MSRLGGRYDPVAGSRTRALACRIGSAFLGRFPCRMMVSVQRILIAVGAVLFLVGLLWPWLSKLGLGRLPGDIRIETASGVFYFPITTCVIISVVLSLVIWFVRR